MFINFEKKFIFIHVFKVGGTSIFRHLAEAFPEISKYNSISDILSGGHPTAKEVSKALKRVNQDFKDFYSFAVVRNTWAWQVSLYLHNTNHIRTKEYEYTEWIENFDQWVDWRVNGGSDKCPIPEVYDKSQLDFILDKDKKIVDTVIQLHEIDKCFRYVCEKINIPVIKKVMKVNQSMVTKTKWHDHYTTFYNSKTKKMIADYFYKDIEYFDFKYGEGT